MRVLVFGGTSFVGRTIVDDLLSHGHTPTLFNRGRTGADLFPGVERLVGDRDNGSYAAIGGLSWDAVVDVSAYVPRHVEQALAFLQDHFGRYVFISSGMVYDHQVIQGEITESSPRLPPHQGSEHLDDASYGRLKVACENVLLDQLGDRLSIVRPGWVVGPHEKAELLTYWVRRAAGTSQVAVPDRLDRPVQVMDVRDLARLVVLLLEKNLPGAFNAVGPSPGVSFVELVKTCGDAELVPVPQGELDFPLLFPDPAWDVMLRISPAAALAAGMPRTPLSQTVADIRAWDRDRGEPPLTSGLSDEEQRTALSQATTN
jgi:nucleoside-diphosphate-sugar epimerase